MSDGEGGLWHGVGGRGGGRQEDERAWLVQGNVIGLVAFDFVLGFVLAGVVDVSFVVHVRHMHLDDSPADPPSLGIPAYTVTHLESLCHPSTPGTSCRGPLNHLMPLILCGLPARGHLAFASGLTSRTAGERSGSVIGLPQKSSGERLADGTGTGHDC